MMRYLYYCNSAYQILTVLNLHWHRKYDGFENIDDYSADMIVLNSFSEASKIADVVRNTNLFEKVILVEKAFNRGKLHSLNTLYDFLNPASYLYRNYSLRRDDVYNRYSVISVPKYSTITAAIWRLNRKARLNILEDGAGIYYDSVNFAPSSRLYKKYYRLINNGKDFYDFDRIYLNNKDLYAGKDIDKVVMIPKYDERFLSEISSYFEAFSDIDDLIGKNIYYFAQFLNNKDTIKLVDDLLEYLIRYNKEIVYVPHPRHKDEKEYDFSYAKKKQIWEIRIPNIDDIQKKLLISIHSTACLTPKILYDKEPYVLLFYKLCDAKVVYRDDKFDRFFESFRQSYRDQSKVMVPENIDELYECIEKYIERENLVI